MVLSHPDQDRSWQGVGGSAAAEQTCHSPTCAGLFAALQYFLLCFLRLVGRMAIDRTRRLLEFADLSKGSGAEGRLVVPGRHC